MCFFKQKTAYEVRISDWSHTCSLPIFRVFLFGDTDKGKRGERVDEFNRGPGDTLRDMWAGGVNLPWNLALAGVLGASLLFTRLTFGAEGEMADADHLIGFLALTVISLAAADVARPLDRKSPRRNSSH